LELPARAELLAPDPVAAEDQSSLVTTVAEIHVIGLILDQQIGLRRRVRLMARQAIQWDQDVGPILRITKSETG